MHDHRYHYLSLNGWVPALLLLVLLSLVLPTSRVWGEPLASAERPGLERVVRQGR